MPETTDFHQPAIPCPQELPDAVVRGLEYFNAGKFFEAHEFLEIAWRAEKGPIRDLYRGILQVGVGYYHLQRGNLNGARKLFSRARKCLQIFSAVQCGIDIAVLLADVDAVEAAMQYPDRLLDQINAGLFKLVKYTLDQAAE